MLTDDGIAYEISFDIQDSDRFGEWFPDATVEWATAPGVRRFRVYSAGDDGQRQRIVFGFEDEDAWRSFVKTPTHQDCMETLTTVGERVITTRWSPSAVTLSGGDPPITDSAETGPDDQYSRDPASERSADAVFES